MTLQRSALRRVPLVSLLAALAPACAGSSDGTPPPDTSWAKPTPVVSQRSPAEQAALDEARARAAELSTLTSDELLAASRVEFASSLPYDPSKASGLAAIDASSLKLSAAEKQRLEQHGFVVSQRVRYPNFVYGYRSIYLEDLPVYVSADSILHAVHRSYDSILARAEERFFTPAIRGVLQSARGSLSQGVPGATPQLASDADVFLAVALSLLDGELAPAVAGGDPARVSSLVSKATSADGAEPVDIFGYASVVDFSLFTPRGHYTESEELRRYFRAMVWLGTIDLRMVDTLQDGSQVFVRPQLEGAVLLSSLLGPDAQAGWSMVNRSLATLVGEVDGMSPTDVPSLLSDLGVADLAGLAGVPDQVVADVISKKGYGRQRIAGQLMVTDLSSPSLALPSTFYFLGQRYTPDSEVFTRLVFDRVGHGAIDRMMPSPLDAAFSVLRNDQAASLLAPELARYPYAPDLAMTRFLMEYGLKPPGEPSVYVHWMSALSELSPRHDAPPVAQAGLPSVATTAAWGRRLLNTQMASWAELRHDNILYAKQSYTTGAVCEFPDAYVDPYPSFFRALVPLAERGKAFAHEAGFEGAGAYFDGLAQVAAMLGDIAEDQRAGLPMTKEHLAFVNEAVTIVSAGCSGEAAVDGWYARLFYDRQEAIVYKPTIADVHTDPNSGGVLHVGTGPARAMVVTVDTCQGPMAYAGLVSSYFEVIMPHGKRLNDDEWKASLDGPKPAEVSWMADLVAH
jgi:hypothetical protein